MEEKKKKEEKLHNSNFIDAWRNAINGIIYAITTQSNIKKQLIIAVIVMIVSLFFDLERTEFLCLTFSVVLIILAEMINTAIETIIDLYTELYHPKAKIAKDVGAGAVVLAALNAVIVAYFLFFDKVEKIGTSIIEDVVKSPTHLAFVCMILVIIGAVTTKALIYKDKEKKKKFEPSGQVAIAFAALLIMWMLTSNMIVLVLSTILTILIVINRKINARTTAEIFFGAFMGILTVLLVYGLTMLNM